jgi:hypothetical protein
MGLGASEERIVPIKQEVQAVVVVRHPSPRKISGFGLLCGRPSAPRTGHNNVEALNTLK